MNKKWKFRRTTLLSVLSLSFLAGLAMARNGSDIHWAWAIFVTAAAIVSFKTKGVAAVAACILLGVVLGIGRGSGFMQKLEPYDRLYGRTVVFEVEAVSDGVYANGGQLEFDAGRVKVLEPFEKILPGKIRIQGHGATAIYRGDIVRVIGKPFKAGGSRQARVSFAQLDVNGRSGLWTESVRREFVAGMQTAIPEPQASFGLGLLVGQRNTLPEQVSEMLSVVGLTHIIAVSGYNLTIIVRGVRRMLGKRSKYQSTVLALVLITSFLLLTGFSASIVRAAIVSVLSIWAWYYGRTIKPILLISFTAAVTAAWNPIYLWSDIGWYLSFLAFFGVLVLAPLIKRRLFGKREPKFLGQVVLESISAQVVTLPLILYIFSETSIVAPLSNALIVPLVPFAMLFSLIGGLAGMLAPIVSGIIAWPATILMTYMLDMAALFARVPYALVGYALSLGGMLLLYVLLISLVVILHKKLKVKYGTITEKSIIE